MDAGAHFFQAQAVYDAKGFEIFMNQAQKFNCPVQVGVVVVRSPRIGEFMNKNISGVKFPQAWIDEIGSVSKEGRKKSF